MSSNPLAFAQASLESAKIDLSESAKFTLVTSIFLLRPQISEVAKSRVPIPPHSINPRHQDLWVSSSEYVIHSNLSAWSHSYDARRLL